MKSARGGHGFDAGRFGGLGSGVQAGAEHGLFAALIARIQKQRGGAALAIDDQDGARFHHAGDVKELVALAQGLLAGTLGSALQDGHRIADFLHHMGTAGGVLRWWKDVGEHGLRGCRSGRQQEDDEFGHVELL